MYKNLYKAAVNEIKVNEDVIKELTEKMKNKEANTKLISTHKLIAAVVAILLVLGISVRYKVQLSESKNLAQVNSKTPEIYLNKIDGIRSAKIRIPEGAYSKDYTFSELLEFFGKDALPTIPKEFKPSSDSSNITFDAQGKMLFMSTLIYSKDINDPKTPSIEIKLNKAGLPPKDCIYNSDLKESVIGSTKVVIGERLMDDELNSEGKSAGNYEIYSAEFIYNGVGYNMMTKRVDQETFLTLLKSIIK